MKDLNALTDRELLILIADRQKRQDREIKEVQTLVTKHEKFKNTMIGAMTTSLVASLTAFFKSL